MRPRAKRFLNAIREEPECDERRYNYGLAFLPPRPSGALMDRITRWVLAHKRIVVGFWLVVTLVGIASAGSATKALKQKFSVPGKEGWETNQQIAREFRGTGGNATPLVPVVTLPAGETVRSPGVRAQLGQIETRLERALPGTRLPGYASTGSRTCVSRDGRTAFVIAYPPPDPNQPFGDNPKAEKRARAALKGTTVAGAPVHLSGFDALQAQSGGGNGPGVLVEALLGGAGALAVLAFVFASFLALVPLLMAITSIMTAFLLVWALTSVTQVSPIVQFLVALISVGQRLDWPHRRTDDKASRAWTRWAQGIVRHRWLAAGGAALILAALVLAATTLQPGVPNANTVAKKGDAKDGLVALERSGIGAGALLPQEVLVRGGSPAQVAAQLARVKGVHGAVAPPAPSWHSGQASLVESFGRADGSSAAGRDTLARVRAAARAAGPEG